MGCPILPNESLAQDSWPEMNLEHPWFGTDLRDKSLLDVQEIIIKLKEQAGGLLHNRGPRIDPHRTC